MSYWRSFPGIKVDLTTEFGVVGGLGVTLFICAIVALATLVFEKHRHGKILSYNETTSQTHGWKRLIKGHWPILAVILLLVLANFLTLTLAGPPLGRDKRFCFMGIKSFDLNWR